MDTCTAALSRVLSRARDPLGPHLPTRACAGGLAITFAACRTNMNEKNKKHAGWVLYTYGKGFGVTTPPRFSARNGLSTPNRGCDRGRRAPGRSVRLLGPPFWVCWNGRASLPEEERWNGSGLEAQRTAHSGERGAIYRLGCQPSGPAASPWLAFAVDDDKSTLAATCSTPVRVGCVAAMAAMQARATNLQTGATWSTASESFYLGILGSKVNHPRVAASTTASGGSAVVGGRFREIPSRRR